MAFRLLACSLAQVLVLAMAHAVELQRPSPEYCGFSDSIQVRSHTNRTKTRTKSPEKIQVLLLETFFSLVRTTKATGEQQASEEQLALEWI